jgi:Domain of unknown function (DU1801)
MSSTNKTQPTELSVKDYLLSYPNPKSTNDNLVLLDLFKKITNKKPLLWGKIVGFGTYHYKYASGRTGEWMMTGFAPSKTGVTIYNIPGYDDVPELMKKLGTYKTGKSCLYVKNLSDININTLEEILSKGFKQVKANYKTS